MVSTKPIEMCNELSARNLENRNKIRKYQSVLMVLGYPLHLQSEGADSFVLATSFINHLS